MSPKSNWALTEDWKNVITSCICLLLKIISWVLSTFILKQLPSICWVTVPRSASKTSLGDFACKIDSYITCIEVDTAAFDDMRKIIQKTEQRALCHPSWCCSKLILPIHYYPLLSAFQIVREPFLLQTSKIIKGKLYANLQELSP